MQKETLNFQTPNSQGRRNLCCTFEATTTKRRDKTPFSQAARRGFSFSTSSLGRIKWKCEGRGAAARTGQRAVRNSRLRAGRKNQRDLVGDGEKNTPRFYFLDCASPAKRHLSPRTRRDSPLRRILLWRQQRVRLSAGPPLSRNALGDVCTHCDVVMI